MLASTSCLSVSPEQVHGRLLAAHPSRCARVCCSPLSLPAESSYKLASGSPGTGPAHVPAQRLAAPTAPTCWCYWLLAPVSLALAAASESLSASFSLTLLLSPSPGAPGATPAIGPAPCCPQPRPVCCGRDLDRRSWSSQDSGLATLEISPPGAAPGRAASPATLALDEDGVRRSSTFPRCAQPSPRPSSPGASGGLRAGGAPLHRSDDLSACRVSSVSTDRSASNEDMLDVTVSSSSSAIVTLETDHSGNAHFSEVGLSSPPGGGAPWCPPGPRPPSDVTRQEVDGRQKKAGPLAGFFSR